MFDLGFLPDIRKIIKHVPAKRQTLLFSATMPDGILHLAHEVLKAPVTVQVNTTGPAKYCLSSALSGRTAPQNRAAPRTVAPYRY